jgi:hypothetical protein
MARASKAQKGKGDSALKNLLVKCKVQVQGELGPSEAIDAQAAIDAVMEVPPT